MRRKTECSWVDVYLLAWAQGVADVLCLPLVHWLPGQPLRPELAAGRSALVVACLNRDMVSLVFETARSRLRSGPRLSISWCFRLK
jgi:hypothetical protein